MQQLFKQKLIQKFCKLNFNKFYSGSCVKVDLALLQHPADFSFTHSEFSPVRFNSYFCFIILELSLLSSPDFIKARFSTSLLFYDIVHTWMHGGRCCVYLWM